MHEVFTSRHHKTKRVTEVKVTLHWQIDKYCKPYIKKELILLLSCSQETSFAQERLELLPADKQCPV